MTKYTIVDQETCIACGTCGSICPDIFGYTDSGEAYVIIDNNAGNTAIPEDCMDEVEEAVSSCPTESIKWSDEPIRLPV